MATWKIFLPTRIVPQMFGSEFPYKITSSSSTSEKDPSELTGEVCSPLCTRTHYHSSYKSQHMLVHTGDLTLTHRQQFGASFAKMILLGFYVYLSGTVSYKAVPRQFLGCMTKPYGISLFCKLIKKCNRKDFEQRLHGQIMLFPDPHSIKQKFHCQMLAPSWGDPSTSPNNIEYRHCSWLSTTLR